MLYHCNRAEYIYKGFTSVSEEANEALDVF